jgi:hypothetical protein
MTNEVDVMSAFAQSAQQGEKLVLSSSPDTLGVYKQK